MLNNNEPIKVFYDGQVFRPEKPLDLPPNTYYEISFQPTPALNGVEAVSSLALSDLYEFIEPVKVATFLAQNDFLEAFLLSAYPSIQTYFPNARLKLEVVPFSDYYKLQIGIYCDKSKDEALLAFWDLKSNWWHEAKKPLDNKLTIRVRQPHTGFGNLGKALIALADQNEEISTLPNEINGLVQLNSEQVLNNATI